MPRKTVQDYLSEGYDLPMAKYFVAGRRTPVKVIPHKDYSLEIIFDNGEHRRLDMLPLIKEGNIWAHLQDWSVFSRVFLDGCHGVAWDIDPNVDSDKFINNRLDYCPDCCYVDSIPLQQFSKNKFTS